MDEDDDDEEVPVTGDYVHDIDPSIKRFFAGFLE